MKKLLLVVAVSTLAAPAFARDIAVTRVVSPSSNITRVSSLSELPSGNTISQVTRVNNLTGTRVTRVTNLGNLTNVSNNSGSTLPPYAEAYAFNMPGIGKGGQAYAYSRELPALGTLNVASSNGGSNGTLSYAESISNK